ncbi:OLC1v1015795C1 [Oldenlandia corymbosa var. corymbosa]|uniref:OLC1v1015795C1 n=1 Tax=Oldenlandia corymbosa var. corymbosa TaxID=529605 RepID=A0AAV1E455_OLDCO|nr:OLC1v1015795C1 [Oldenlandia corymbosa var. corymbosa]
MAISTKHGSKKDSSDATTPLLDDSSTEDELIRDYVNYTGQPCKRSESGGWQSAAFISGAGGLERFAFRGMECNLINFLTGPLGESVAVASANVNIWMALGSIMPVVNGILADSVLGLYRTNIITSIIYILGLGLSTISVVIIPSNDEPTTNNAAVPTILQVLFFFSIYLVALAQGFQSSSQVFGADQFDRNHPQESKAISSFFNWWLFGLSVGVVLAILMIPYIEENISWGMGFGTVLLAMVIGFILLVLGYRTYRFALVHRDQKSPIDDAIYSTSQELDQESLRSLPEGKFQNHKKNLETKKALGLLPIWCTTVMYTLAWAQAPTLFTKQANTVDRSIGQSFEIPSASLRIFIPLTTMCFTPIYDRVFVAIGRKITGNPTGITEFQRIKMGMTISIVDMVVAALIEKKRLEIARDHSLVDIPNAMVPMSFWWLVPQNVLCSFAYVFTFVGMQKFFYDQVPDELRSIGLSLSFGALGAGNFLSSFLIYGLDRATSVGGRYSWFCDNLSRAHLDYFYWVVAGLGFLGLVGFALLEKSFSKENVAKKNTPQPDSI